jgi:predicted permease
MDTFLVDLRHAFRVLSRMRGVALVATLTLGLGIGATTTMFSVVYAALLRPLPFPEPDRLAMLYATRTSPRAGTQRVRWSQDEIHAIQSTVASYDTLGSFTAANVNLTGNGEPEHVEGEIASPGYFRVLGVVPVRGRTFLDEEDTTPSGHPVALISARLWQRRFHSDPSILGRPIGINDVALTIVGVLPDAFTGVSGRAEIWVPTTMAPRLTYADYLITPQHFINVVGRLKPGVSIARADAELAALAGRLVRPDATVDVTSWGATVWTLGRARVDAAMRSSVLVLLGAVSCVLLIACVNVASLLLARARTRRREMAIRLAVGSGTVRLVRQLLTESAVLALFGGALGILLATWGVDAIAAPSALASPRNGYAQVGAFAMPTLNGAVLLFALAITLGTSLVFGLVPALAASRTDLGVGLKDDGRGGGATHRRGLGQLVASEIALAVLLLSGAGLLVKSFTHMQDQRVGFVPDGVVAFWVTPPASRYTPADGPAIVERLLLRVQQVPGVQLASVNRCTPFDARCARTVLFLPGRPADPATAPTVGRHYVSADYFEMLGIPVRAGRALSDRDRAGAPPVTVVNEEAARRFWPGEDPVGKRVWFGSSTGFTDPARPVEVVGVVGNVKYGEADDPVMPDFYTSYLQFTYPDTMMIVKGRQPLSLVPSLRSAIASIDPGLPIYDVRTLDERIDASLSRPRFNMALLAAFAAAALLLAAIGVYGVMAYSVSSRLHEIGVRLALGADATRVVRLVLSDGARLAGAGAVLGLAAALAATRLMRNLLYNVTPTDPAILAGVVLLTMLVALSAAFLPARRAGAVDPVIALRQE